MGASHNPIGLPLIAAGVVLVLVGLLAWLGLLGWLGHLPGDIRIERETFKLYIPLASMLLLSVVLSLIVYVVRRFL